jgi:hypothetical protein
MESLIDIGIILTYLMIGTASIFILTDKYWKYFMIAWGLMLLDVALMVFGVYAYLLIPPIVWLSFICLVILCPVIMALMDKNKRISALYKFGGFLAILLITYLFSSSEVLHSYEKYEITASTVKKVGMGLTAFYVLAIGAIGAVLYAELSKVFSK